MTSHHLKPPRSRDTRTPQKAARVASNGVVLLEMFHSFLAISPPWLIERSDNTSIASSTMADELDLVHYVEDACRLCVIVSILNPEGILICFF